MMLRLMIALLAALIVASLVLPGDNDLDRALVLPGYDSLDRTLMAPSFQEDDCYFADVPTPMELAPCRRDDPYRIGMIWADQDREVSYRVSGKVDYWFVSCDDDPPFGPTARIEFAETLPVNTTWFVFPPTTDERTNAVHEYSFAIEAIDQNGNVLARDGEALIAEPPWACRVDRDDGTTMAGADEES